MAQMHNFLGWYCEEDRGDLVGPLSVTDVVKRLDAGDLRPDAPVWEAWRERAGVRLSRTQAAVARGLMAYGILTPGHRPDSSPE